MACSISRAVILLISVGSTFASFDHEFAALLHKRGSPVVPSTLPGTWTYQGCYTENGPRTLPAASYTSSTNMTDENCIEFCAQRGYIYAGTEYSQECYCGNSIGSTSSVASSTDCSMTCTGNLTEACGGSNRISIYRNGSQPPAGPSTNSGTSGYGFLGCYTEGNNGRALTNQLTVAGGSGATTVALCVAACKNSGYSLAGVEYADECYCGNAISNAAILAPEGISGCNMLCAGNSTEYCGAGNRLDIYKQGYIGTQSADVSVVFSTTSLSPRNSISLSLISSNSKLSTTTSSSSTKSSSSSIGLCTNPTLLSKSSSNCSTQASTSSSVTLPIATTSILKPGVSVSSSGLASGATISSSKSSTVLYASSLSSPKSTSSSGFIASVSTVQSNSLSLSKASPSAPSSVPSTFSSTSSPTSVANSPSVVSSSMSGTSISSSATISSTLGIKQNVGSYIFLGCYTEGSGTRALTGTAFFDYNAMNLENCAVDCAAYTYWGVEYGGECWCGNSIDPSATLAPTQSDCSFTCPGNQYEYCGAGNRLEMYSSVLSSSSSTIPSTSAFTTTSHSFVPTAKSSNSVSGTSTSGGSSSFIRSSSSSTRSSFIPSELIQSATFSISSTTSTTLSSGSSVSITSPSSINLIATKSSSSSSSLMLLSNSVSISQSLKSSSTNTSPSASPTLGIVQSVGNYNYLGCYTEGTNVRALTPGASASDTMTVESCAASCSTYYYFGVEYGRECYCGNSLAASSTLAPATDCSFNCAGNSLEYCGAGNRLNVYILNGTGTQQDPSATGSIPTATQSTTATGLPVGWKYDGCYSEGTNGRALSFQQAGGNTNTIESCINACIGLGYSISGVEYSSQCFCGNFLYNGAASTAASACQMTCSGNTNEICGGPNALSIYNTGNLTVYSPPSTQKTNLPGSWAYQGCYSDNVNNNRALFWQSILTNNNTATSCLTLCAEYGYMAAGMEYGDECYCGDDTKLIASGSTIQPETDCQVVCSGDSTFYCGGGSRLSYYKWNGTDLYTWNTPNGTAAGKYEFLIGGVVVPLITIPAINKKVVFMEKSGTGAPNTTGTYELDLAFIDEFSSAWRALHVKSDIFCSAGVTLPDKSGRLLNIGGWSGSSTYGVRLYMPDGSPGVPGVNDWQEDVNEISLLEGRWYPSAMVMANGSVLVLGGEVGSNAAPTPSCEILPPPSGGYAKYLDWLDRTDPDNLYPFMFVLPTGNIFVVYYNEARIIDESTFDTIKTLPNLPGSVNNFLSGRTYPLEGTGVILPMYAPFTAPVTVLVCGGSANGAAYAIDNCVSTQPEVASPAWTLERMPSQRVMSCICALPDGTFIILNGAQEGVAGFGLATDPNYNAILYDPTKPVNQRMSIMDTTIVARLYHSEAVLLPDGRVMVSGSDPEDGVNPEEYRVEVFRPPYDLNGLPKPSYNITTANKDWSYGSTSQITADIPSGNLTGVRISMMAAVTSTHGNSMGQRTLFLASSCKGSSNAAICTITTPPTAHVAPPGWYMIFILDGPTPGEAEWIRIGGSIADAAGIGNWPSGLSDFSTPGLGPVES